jgi:hypothetical protein
MSRYHLTEAYGELHNPRLTEASFYDNLRFVDFLQGEEIEEVMESLIWEFMDYGDTLDEAVDTLEVTFSDDEVLCESLELINEASRMGDMRMAQRRETRAKQKTESERTTAERDRTLSSFAKRDADTAARARRAERSAAIRGALSGAKRSVKGAMATAHKQIRDKKAQLKQVGSAASEKAKAAIQKVGRGGRRIMNAVKGGIEGAKSGYKAPLAQPTPRTPGREQTQQTRDAARTANGDVFATPSSPRAAAAAQSLRSATSAETNRPRLGLRGLSNRPAAPVNPTAFPSRTRSKMGVQVTSKAGNPLKGAAVAPAIRSARKKQTTNESVDYDLLTQYMIEDLINEGYADTESQAVSILEDMTTETLTEFASIYLDD